MKNFNIEVLSGGYVVRYWAVSDTPVESGSVRTDQSQVFIDLDSALAYVKSVCQPVAQPTPSA